MTSATPERGCCGTRSADNAAGRSGRRSRRPCGSTRSGRSALPACSRRPIPGSRLAHDMSRWPIDTRATNAFGEPQQTAFAVTHTAGSADYVMHFPPDTFSGNAGKLLTLSSLRSARPSVTPSECSKPFTHPTATGWCPETVVQATTRISTSGVARRRPEVDRASRRKHPTCPPVHGRERGRRCGTCRPAWPGTRRRPHGVVEGRIANPATPHRETRGFARSRRARLRRSGAGSTNCSRSARSHASPAEPRRGLGPYRTR